MSALAALQAHVRTTFGLVADAGGVLDVERTLARTAPGETPEAAAAAVLGSTARMGAFIDELVVGESHFLRQPAQLELVADVVSLCLEERGACFVWCAGSSTGEEPWSVALLAHARRGAALDGLRVLGTDVSARATVKAVAARYSSWSFRGCPPWIRTHFDDGDGALILRTPAIRAVVEHETAELLARASTFAPGSVDIVLFRNVAIYLSAEHLEAFYATVARALRSDGRLVLGAADPRPTAGFIAVSDDPDRCTFAVVGDLVSYDDGVLRPAPTTKSQPTRRHLRAPTRSPRPRATPTSREPGAITDPDGVLQQARRAADGGAFGDALALVGRLVASAGQEVPPWLGRAFTVLGLVHLGSDDVEAACEALRRAVYLAPGEARARGLYGLALRRAGRVEAARPHLREAARLLAGDHGGAIDVDSGDRTELQAAIAAALDVD